MTRSRARQEERDELERAQKEALSCGVPKPLELTSPTVSGGNGEASAEEVVLESEFPFSEDFFLSKPVRTLKTKSQKRAQRHSHGLERAKDQKPKKMEVPVSREVLLQIQSTDVTLEKYELPVKGSKKTVERILRRFYWPTIYRDTADFCGSYIIGPLPRRRAGHCYVLVVCDDATRYLEAVPLRTVDTEAIAEELVKIFSRMGIPVNRSGK
uniref:Integrase zinc-binding domain-containing protein n=1 Tax=Amphimedon queenslandica TaxID=400682 RepID=A0A1X7TSH1_AMPQE